MNTSTIINVFGTVLIPIIIGFITYSIAKKQILNAGVTQFRQKWIDDLRNSISVFIAKAEMISMLEFEDDSYFEYFQELAIMHSKIELLLNPNEDAHNNLVNLLTQIRDLIHEDHDKEEIFQKSLDKKITKLLDNSKIVLKREWEIVKKGK